MKRYFQRLTEFQQGLLLIGIGVFLLLFSLGTLGRLINMLIAACAIGVICWGIVKTKFHKKIIILLENPKKK